MRILKFILIIVVFIALFTSCGKQNLHEEDLLMATSATVLYVEGNLAER
ncbi:hypothetical protein Q4566_16355 [Tamlana sp. 2_MG-2023]|nr:MULTISPECIES: hypothetical protein [unclassified Tamlana]MDO6761782.1 hypothetical protein [Tamlana sp. 2_MG-2023]MDO6792543.1 hypothetical protein [Tamlana sp. 1_MG-2023]